MHQRSPQRIDPPHKGSHGDRTPSPHANRISSTGHGLPFRSRSPSSFPPREAGGHHVKNTSPNLIPSITDMPDMTTPLDPPGEKPTAITPFSTAEHKERYVHLVSFMNGSAKNRQFIQAKALTALPQYAGKVGPCVGKDTCQAGQEWVSKLAESAGIADLRRMANEKGVDTTNVTKRAQLLTLALAKDIHAVTESA